MDNAAADAREIQEAELSRFHRGTNQSGMRAHNERIVLTLVRRAGALAKADIARMTGLSAQTVSVIMRQLEADGLLLRGEPIRGKVGQPSVPMRLAPDGAYFFGLKLGRRSADLVLCNFTGETLAQEHHTYPYPTPAGITAHAAKAMNRMASGLPAGKRKRIAGLGIAMPFQMWEWAEAMGAPQEAIDAWRTCDIDAELTAATGMPAYVQNDASAACNAELVFGPGNGPRDFLYFYIGFFAGGGVVLNGSLYVGRTGNAGALGSMPVTDRSGRMSQLIGVASIATLARMLEARGLPSAMLHESLDRWSAVDRDVLDDWIDQAGQGLAQAIVSATSVIDFEATVIDGWFPGSVRSALTEAAARHLARMNLAGLEPVAVRAGTAGPNARAMGAAALPLSERFLVDQHAVTKEP